MENLDFLKMLTFASKEDLVRWSPGLFLSFLSPHILESVLLISQTSGRHKLSSRGPGQVGPLGEAGPGGGGHGQHSGARQRPQS